MTATTSTAYSRDLGDELRLLRETCTNLNGRAFAIHLGWDPSKVSNIEHGKARASEIDLVQFLTACGKDLDYFHEFRNRYHNAFDPYFAQVSDNLRTLAMTESMAKKITAYDVLTVNGLMQTEKYARTLIMETRWHDEAEVEKFVQIRMERQAVMRRPNRPECVFYIHELALQMLLGDAKTVEDQYLRLLFNTHVLRVVPADVKAAAFQSKCTIYEFEKAPPVAYTETDMVQVFAQDSAAVEQSRRLFERLDAVALDEEQSRSKLAEYVSGLREDPHDHGTDLA
ncbi:helix-turn-helix transcriptional regulator [Lentzea roselyniae]|uniref:Helix-turn-helix transcriptional regulator n=1 Tax=Lentzea roselyniae TaxID=531940 RepID=A0ABP7A705_9PSEU